MRKISEIGLLLLILSLPWGGNQGPALAYEPPMGNLQAWVDGYFVHFTVTDPVRGLQQGNVWQPPLLGSSIIIQGLQVQDGVVAWIHGHRGQFDLVYSYYVHYVTYDPEVGDWQKGVWGPYDEVGNVTLQGGVVAWAYRLGDSDWAGVDFAIYDPLDKALHQSGLATPGPLPFISVSRSTVFWGSNVYGYRHSESWVSGSYTPVVSHFVGQPPRGSCPLTVWFTDMSISGTNWSWDFGDDATSSSHSPSHVFTKVGVYSVKLLVTTDVGSSSISERTVVVGASLAPIRQLLLD